MSTRPDDLGQYLFPHECTVTQKDHFIEHKLLISKECHLILIYIMHSLCTYLSEANNENHLYSKKGAVHCFVIVELI